MLTQLIIVAIVVSVVNYCSCGCPETFKDALVDISYSDRFSSIKTTLNGCLHNDTDIRYFYLRTCTKIILANTFLNLSNLHRITLDKANVFIMEPTFAENTPRLWHVTAAFNQIAKIQRFYYSKFKAY